MSLDRVVELGDAELVFGFVSPLGTLLDLVEAGLYKALGEHRYMVQSEVRISRYISQLAGVPQELRPDAVQDKLMEVGSHLRRRHGGDFLALMAVSEIELARPKTAEGEAIVEPRKAHIIRSLKHPDEVVRLRQVYGKGFFLIGVTSPHSARLQHLINQNFPKDEAERLLEKDAGEDDKLGQQTRDTFELADAYVRVETTGDEATDMVEGKVRRIVDLLMSCPFHPPNREEHAMFTAYAAALRSGDLSRQVGAVIMNRAGDLIATGANDAPAAGGGPHWPESHDYESSSNPNAGPDYLRGYDSNERERNKILVGVIEALTNDKSEPDDPATFVKKYEDRLRNTGILDLTEFGRAVHAEMAALMSCVRSGASAVRGTLYCTTFPCHNCAKHIIAAGISEVVYVEPYPKSKAKLLHDDAIQVLDDPGGEHEPDPVNETRQVVFRAFEGVGPRRFVDLFSLSWGSGRPLRRKQKHSNGARLGWERGRDSYPRLPLDHRSYLEREAWAAKDFQRKDSEDETSSEGDDPTQTPREA